MKHIPLLIMLIAFPFISTAQALNRDFDPELAKKLGADDYGMKTYMFVMLKTGPNIITDNALRDSLFKGHMANITKLSDMGKLIVAGPFGKNNLQYRGIFILDVRSEEEATELLKGDPAVREKVFEAQIIPWYGSAALPEYLKIARKIAKTGF